MYGEVNRTHQGSFVSIQAYNLVIGGVTLYGLFMNVIMCYLFQDYFAKQNFWAILIGYILSCLVGYFLVIKSNNPIVSFIGYNLIVLPVGVVVSIAVSGYSSTVVLKAFATTAAVTLLMIIFSTLFPSFFSGIGKGLFFSLLLSLIVETVMFFLGVDLGIIDWIVAVIFCGYIGFDWARANRKEKTLDNAVDSAAEIYLDIINVFLRLLSVMGRDD